MGNLLFAATHELGHAVVSEFDLPVLGREENAADDFAILSAATAPNLIIIDSTISIG